MLLAGLCGRFFCEGWVSPLKTQLTLRGVIIGCIGCAVITASSTYVALRMGALPWPIIFAAIVSLCLLKAVSRGSATLNEANVTHTLMSAGAMVAGGLAFTIPGAWMLGLADEISLLEMLVIALAGVGLGLIFTALIRKHFIEETELEFPIGQAAAQTLIAGESGGRTGLKLFGSMGVAGLFALLRDGLGLIPGMLATVNIPGVVFGIYASPMMLSVGFLVGTAAIAFLFAGAVFSNFGVMVCGTSAGLLSLESAQALVSSLGMGLMIGGGLAVVAKDIIPKIPEILGLDSKGRTASPEAAPTPGPSASPAAGAPNSPNPAPNSPNHGALTFPTSAKKRAALMTLGLCALALILTMALGLAPHVSVLVVLLSFVTCTMSSQSVGQTGVDPMEVFGIIVLLIVAGLSDSTQVQLFFIAAVIAVACGLAGDVMNDFKAGHVLGTNPKAQIIGQAIGGVLGALVAVAVMHILLAAYGPEAFGGAGEFAAAQASVVASMVGGIPHLGGFIAGVFAGFVLHLFRIPSVMLGLGVYLPFYMSLTAFLGAMLKLALDAIVKRRAKPGEEATCKRKSDETSLIIASGLIGGESIVGILLALAAASAWVI